MRQPISMPTAERFKHGTRSRYVCGCRCDACRASNTAYYHERQRVCKALAAEIEEDGGPVTVAWTPPGQAVRTRTYARACHGAQGEPCPKRSHLRKDSSGGVCCFCRRKLGFGGLVDAAPAVAHMVALTSRGVGKRAIHDASGIALAILEKIRRGSKTKIRRSTRDRILAVDDGARADASLVPAGPTWDLIGKLIGRGWRKRDIARALGRKGATPCLQLQRDFVLASSALKVERLFRADAAPPEHGTRWSPRFCDCISPSLARGRCSTCGGLGRPDGMTRALAAGGSGQPKALTRAFGFDGGWNLEQRQSRVGKKREDLELRRMARQKPGNARVAA